MLGYAPIHIVNVYTYMYIHLDGMGDLGNLSISMLDGINFRQKCDT